MDGRIDLERARRDAKALLRAARAGEARLRADREPVLADAQRAVAKELGFPSWPAMVRAVAGERLLAAARDGRADDVHRLLMEGAPANYGGPDGTALHVAASHGRADVVSVLVGWVPVDPGATDAEGRTAWSEDPVVARMLLAGGVSAPADAQLDWTPTPPAEDHALGEAAWAAEAALFELLSSSPLAERRAHGDGFAFRTGSFDNTRNGVVCSRAGDVHAVRDWLGAPAQWLIGPRSDLGPRLERAGWRPDRTAVFMAADTRREPGEGVVEITDADALRAALAAVDELEPGDGEAALLASLGFSGPMRHFAAVRDGEPVGLVSTFSAAGTLTITHLAVAPGRRRQGIGRALVGHAAHGLTLLGPTPATVPFYGRLGFRLLRFPPDRAFHVPV
ncbi:GNAT family N-acetyltransferase [Candidatus Solirubrobacter pratensis]|uniref:GNAT family N-acetyltransferase n=1 Tax=Candidatus Solirubrobacter pratensis TaxID=1298857 RepID=UPI0003FE8B05|nr:GNAT family N-acetyltransferase [Candidatus Solirubrobacter pratensis]